MRVLTYPDAVLRQTAYDVDPSSDTDLLRLVNTMFKIMYDAPGIGLAAPQIGIQKRAIVFDLDDDPMVLLNPKIVESSDPCSPFEEGCLSVPGITATIVRSDEVVCEGMDLDGKLVRVDGNGLLSRVLQHEIDHLDGLLILDRMTPEERKTALERYREINL